MKMRNNLRCVTNHYMNISRFNNTSKLSFLSVKHVKYFIRCKSTQCTTLSVIQTFATKSPLKMMKNGFYFTSKALVVPKIFKFSS